MESAVLIKEISDEALVEKMKAGSEAAYTELVRRYMKKAYSIAYQFVGNSEDAKDLSQDVFIKIYQSISSFREEYKFFSWFYRILMNHCINFRKKESKFLFNTQELTDYRISDSSENGLIDEKIQKDELRTEINRAIAKLPLKQREIVILCEIEGLSQREVSEILNMSEGTVRSRLFYARRKLKKYLMNYIK